MQDITWMEINWNVDHWLSFFVLKLNGLYCFPSAEFHHWSDDTSQCNLRSDQTKCWAAIVLHHYCTTRHSVRRKRWVVSSSTMGQYGISIKLWSSQYDANSNEFLAENSVAYVFQDRALEDMMYISTIVKHLVGDDSLDTIINNNIPQTQTIVKGEWRRVILCFILYLTWHPVDSIMLSATALLPLFLSKIWI